MYVGCTCARNSITFCPFKCQLYFIALNPANICLWFGFSRRRKRASWSVSMLKKNCKTSFPTGYNRIFYMECFIMGPFIVGKRQHNYSRCRNARILLTYQIQIGLKSQRYTINNYITPTPHVKLIHSK